MLSFPLDESLHMNPTVSLFLRQSYQDAWSDYQRSLLLESNKMEQVNIALWDYVILTASNEKQAQAYRKQIEVRQNKKLLVQQTHYAVLPDPDGKRVGSGGATLNVLRYIAEQEENKSNTSAFQNKRILVIHSGGDSKRVPQYSACGKLFSPVPRELPNGKRSTLFDEFMISMSGVPSRIKEGMLVLSGDVLLLFNPLQIEMPTSGAAAISFKEDAKIGKNHGVFHMDESGNVGEFLHKQSVDRLTEKGAVNPQGKVDIDTGAILFSTDLMRSLYALVCDKTGKFDAQKFRVFVNENARLSFYADFLYPLASKSTLAAFYNEKSEGEFCEELTQCRTALWEAMSKYRMKLLRLSPASFIHFGTTQELLHLVTKEIENYSFLDWKKCVACPTEEKCFAVNNAMISQESEIGDDCYIENSFIFGKSQVGKECVLSHVTVTDQCVPEKSVLHGLKLTSNTGEPRFAVRLYGILDNPKLRLEDGTTFLHTTLPAFLKKTGLQAEDLWDDGIEHTLWTAKLYPVCRTLEEAISASLNLYTLTAASEEISAFRAAERTSLWKSFDEADTEEILLWDTRLRKTVKVEKLMQTIQNGGTCEQACEIFKNATVSDEQLTQLSKHAEHADYSVRIRLYYFVGKILGGSEGEKYIQKAFATIAEMVFSAMHCLPNRHQIAEQLQVPSESVTVQLPLRVNWGGGWSDTPPYCNEHGGTVLNAAVLLNGKMPVEVQVSPLKEQLIRLASADIGAQGEFTCISELQNCSNPYDTFALHKAALITCGVIPRSGGNLSEILAKLGCGICLSTQVHQIPKGSGLGTSSILAAASVKAIFMFLKRNATNEDIYAHVMYMEQIMSTGGGWQDQVGGLTKGIKYIKSNPGVKQSLKIRDIQLAENTKTEFNERFALIYTGQRRLARNLLRDVVGRYISAKEDSLFALEKIQQVAAMMIFELERGNLDGFAELLNEHWILSQKIDADSSNTCIDQIFLAIEDLIAGKMICGAGGGGFLQVILKKGVSKDQLRARLYEVFQDCGVEVWDSALFI